VSEQIICWRRDRVLTDPSGGWTDWKQVQLAPNEVRDMTL
jgi:hypothetical protein